MFSATDHRLMARALELAARGLNTTDPNPRVGCVIAREGEVIGEGWTSPAGGPHAEIHALRMAGAAARGATVYVSLEPCSHHGRTPPCTDALVAAGVGRVICAMRDPNPLVVDGNGVERLRSAGIAVENGLLERQARELNVGFCKRMTQGLPFVTVKIAASLDGKVALRNGISHWITGEAARRDVQHLRARSSAVLTGIGTVLADDPLLTVRDPGIDMLGRKPLRVVCDTRLRIPDSAKLLKEEGPVAVYTAATPKPIGRADVRASPVDASGSLDLRAVLKDLAARECNEVLVEAGPTLSGRFVEQGLADRLIVYLSPVLLGSEARSMVALPPLDAMAGRTRLELIETRHVGEDLRLTWRLLERPG